MHLPVTVNDYPVSPIITTSSKERGVEKVIFAVAIEAQFAHKDIISSIVRAVIGILCREVRGLGLPCHIDIPA